MNELHWWLLGLAAGVAGMIPFAWLAARRTERRMKRLQERTRATERLAELGTLTGGLAHEIKNPLSTIGLNLQLLQESLDEADIDGPHESRLRRRIEALSGEVEHLRGILEDFLRFAGRMKLERQPVRVNQLVDELIDFFSPQAEQSGVQLRSRLDEADPEASLDPQLIKQALLNLMINATQAMVQARYNDKPHGGATDLIIQTRDRDSMVEVHVTDTGPGIDAEQRERIFEPYFSTKRGGTGLGLPTTRRIVEEHGGQLDLHSELGKGSDFVIALPRQADDPAEADGAAAD